MGLFSPQSGGTQSFDLLPPQLALAVISVRDIRQNKSGGSRYDLELTLASGPQRGRKLWDAIGVPFDTNNKEVYRKMGTEAVTRILECAGEFDPAKPESYDKFDGNPNPTVEVGQAMDGKTIGIRIGVEKRDTDYDEKNRVKEWLSPNPQSGGFSGWKRLQESLNEKVVTTGAPVLAAVAPATSSSPAWLNRPKS